MPSSYTASLRFNLQATGENNNTWGVILNNGVFQLVDTSIAGWLTKALTGNYSLTTGNGTTDEARTAILNFTGAGANTVTVPAVPKRYDVVNGCTGLLTLTNGSTSVTVQPGEVAGVITDGGANFRRVQPTDFAGQNLTTVGGIGMAGAITGCSSLTGLANPTAANQAANKGYVDTAVQTAVWTIAGGIAIVPANSGQLLTNNGSTPNWSSTLPTLNISGAAGTPRSLNLQTGGLNRWGIVAGNAAETGANAGSPLNFNAFDDTGAFLSTPLSIIRSTGVVTFGAAGVAWNSGRALIDNALAADIQVGTAANKVLTPSALMASSAFQVLTDAATIVWNCAAGYNATVTLSASGHTVGNPTGLFDGLSVSLELVQGGAGAWTVNWGTIWDFGAAGLPTLQTTAGKADRVFGQYNARTGKIECSFRKGA